MQALYGRSVKLLLGYRNETEKHDWVSEGLIAGFHHFWIGG